MLTRKEIEALDDLAQRLIDGSMMYDVEKQYRLVLAGFIYLMTGMDSIGQISPFFTGMFTLAEELGERYEHGKVQR